MEEIMTYNSIICVFVLIYSTRRKEMGFRGRGTFPIFTYMIINLCMHADDDENGRRKAIICYTSFLINFFFYYYSSHD
ncbi:hypothetical protein JHK82_029717 [Glycine max]|uniref:Uncharacterized protein n=2 Tax=Glycine subgen. Soja TaxID=1462606 RepID=A0A0R0HAP7_SOYBN|nr:hypothetical protein JHK87_029597 [Glycine soja]KAG4987344.1 hypothetical protein JHK85_030327 [Glycine max]KAG4992972.1 hypothetical protein JHK86_029799 [Glycine max]KAG5122980.1 hypothetical protein JHK82_029717 [Glycine max]KAG5144393.1 hypothetical protein JHK84_029936 [Glycine max]